MKKLWRAYLAAILIVVHALLLFAAVNGAAFVALETWESDPLTLTYGDATGDLARVYPGRSRGEIRELLRESWERTPAFEPFLVSRERKFRGRFVNVDPQGFRLVRDQVPWPPDASRLDVFVFGGSTAFGYGVADHETIASALQSALRGRVPSAACYNFGSAGYYSTQERILFEGLLLEGGVPDIAVFVDGINEFAFNQPWLTPSLRAFMATPVKKSVATLIQNLPVTRLIEKWKARRDLAKPEHVGHYNDRRYLDTNIERYLANRRLIQEVAAARGIKVLFVWQPTPLYAYDLGANAFRDFDFGFNNYSRFGYPLFEKKLRQQPLGNDFLWAAEIQRGSSEPLYVDQIHYSAALNARLADEIARTLDVRGYLPAH